MSAPEVLIAGTGAMACLFAARLAASGRDVAMLGTWPEGLRALRERGARLLDADGQAHAYPVRATDDPKDCAGVKTALVLVKSWQTARAAGQLRECLAEDGLALSLQNGLGNLETLAEALGNRRAAAGSTTYGATMTEPGVVRALGEGEVTLAKTAQAGVVESLLRGAGFQLRQVDGLSGLLWGKLVVNAAVNPLTALLDVPNGFLLAQPEARSMARALAKETAATARCMGIRLPFEDPVEAMEAVVRRTAENSSSMRQDLLRGAPTEVDAINGAVARHGKQCGVETPYNRVMWMLVRARANRNQVSAERLN